MKNIYLIRLCHIVVVISVYIIKVSFRFRFFMLGRRSKYFEFWFWTNRLGIRVIIVTTTAIANCAIRFIAVREFIRASSR